MWQNIYYPFFIFYMIMLSRIFDLHIFDLYISHEIVFSQFYHDSALLPLPEALNFWSTSNLQTQPMPNAFFGQVILTLAMMVQWIVEDDDHDDSEDDEDDGGVGVGVGDIVLPEDLVPPFYCSPDTPWQRGQRDDPCADHHHHHHYGDHDHNHYYGTDSHFENNLS